MDAIYDEIGRNYLNSRSTDPRVLRALRSQFGGARVIVNLGAGSGSYEPDDLDVIAIEPSKVMISQRPAASSPVIQAVVENLPFADNSFDLAMGVLTLHHWSNW